jgi:hypothetical protein
MRRRTPCFIATSDELVASGLQPDRHELKQALWEHALNVYFANGKVRRKKPAAQAFVTNGSPIRGLGELHADDGGRWLWTGANESIYRWAFGAPELILAGYGEYRAEQSGGLQPTIYDFTPYGNWMIFNDGILSKRWDGNAVQDYGGGEVPQNVTRFMKKMNFMMALGYGTRGTRIGWSDADDIFTWTASADNLAGSLSIDEFDTPIRAAERLGDYIACYAEDQMALVKFVGAPFVFGQKFSLDGIGAVGKAAVATDTRINVGLGRNGAWLTDSNSFKYIDEGIIRDHFQENINWDKAAVSVVMRNDATGCFEFHVPTGVAVQPTEGWSFDPRNGSWSPVPVRAFKSERRLFGSPICGTNGGIVQLDDNDYALAGPLELRTKPLMLTSENGENRGTHIVSRVDEVEILAKEASNVEFRIGSSDDPHGDWDWSEWTEFEPGSRIQEVPQDVPENSLWKLDFRSVAAAGNDWRLDLQGFVLYGPDVGTKLER